VPCTQAHTQFNAPAWQPFLVHDTLSGSFFPLQDGNYGLLKMFPRLLDANPSYTYQDPAMKIVLSIQSCFPEHETKELQLS